MKLVILLGIFLMPAIAYCQKVKTDLGIGDKIPEVELKVWRNGKMEIRKLSDYYKYHGMIIDLWATWCSSCIVAMKDVQEELRASHTSVKFLPVTYEDSASVRNFVMGNKILRELPFDFATDDSLLMGRYFKFNTIPHEVWIDRQGIIRGITRPDQITTANLKAFELGAPVTLKEKKQNLDFKVGDTLDVGNAFISRSLLTRVRPELMGWVGTFAKVVDKRDKNNFFQALNTSILQLFYSGFNYGVGKPIEWSRIELHVSDTQRIFPNFSKSMMNVEVLEGYQYCYELLLPEKVSRAKFRQYILEDLNRFFPYKAEVKNRVRECWVMTLFDPVLLNAKLPADAEMKTVFKTGPFLKYANNITTDELSLYLDLHMDSLRVVNATGVDKSFDISFPEDISLPNSKYMNIEAVKICLRRHGLDLHKEKRAVEILAIVEK